MKNMNWLLPKQEGAQEDTKEKILYIVWEMPPAGSWLLIVPGGTSVGAYTQPPFLYDVVTTVQSSSSDDSCSRIYSSICSNFSSCNN